MKPNQKFREQLQWILRTFKGDNYLIFSISENPFWEGVAAYWHHIDDEYFDCALKNSILDEFKSLWDTLEDTTNKSYDDFDQKEYDQVWGILAKSEEKIKALINDALG